MLVASAVVAWLACLAVLARIFLSDLRNRIISNNDVLALLVFGLIALGIETYLDGNWLDMLAGIGVAAICFVAMLVFWRMGKLGAGDVKLVAVAIAIIGANYILYFSVVLLSVTIVVLILIYIIPQVSKFVREKNLIDVNGFVPFGVPLAFSLGATIILRLSLTF